MSVEELMNIDGAVRIFRFIKSKFLLFLYTIFFVSISTLSAQHSALPEYQIKAVFLYNFAQFVEWPSEAYENARSPFIIGVLGDDPFGSYLDETVSGEKVNNHPMMVKRFKNIEDVKDCHILFISYPNKENFKEIFPALKNKNVLTVSDSHGFIKEGGMIKFLNENSKIKIGINLEAAKAANLVISSKLLRLAEIVTQ
jgi:hypothetical protein